MAKFNHDEIRDTLRIHERTQNISATAQELGAKRGDAALSATDPDYSPRALALRGCG